MSALYWFALIIGAGLLLLSLFGDILGHGDGPDTGGHDADGHGDAEGFRILSMRNATYFLFAFGAAGLLVGWAFDGLHPVATAVVAALLGLVAGGISGAVFGWVSRTESGYMADDRGWVGRIGEVVLPLAAAGTGKILVARDGREQELLARPFDREPESPEQWKSVMIMELENGVALVAPIQGSLEDPSTLRITPSTES
jgi:hypothetical protein